MTTATKKAFKHNISVMEDEQYLFFCNCNPENAPYSIPVFSETYEDFVARDGHMPRMVVAPNGNPVEEVYDHRRTNKRDVCPKCGDKSTIHMSLYGRASFASEDTTEYAKIYDNGDLISLAYGVGTYTYNPSVRKVGYRKTRYRLTFNAKTGNTYFLHRGKVRNVTYQFYNGHDAVYTLRAIENDFAPGIVTEFFKLCAERRGLKYLDLSRTSEADYIGELPQILKFPVLENFPTYSIGVLPPKFRKPIASMTKLTEVYELLMGTSAKSIRKHIKTTNDVVFYRDWQNVIHEVSNLSKLVEHHASFTSRGRSLLFYDSQMLASSPLRHITFAKDVLCDGDETVFVNRVLKEKKPSDPNDRKSPLVRVAPDSLAHTLEDIQRMYPALAGAIEDYSIEYRGSFTRLHDEMAVEYNRLRNGNYNIPYEEADLERYNRSVGPLEFRATETTERIRDIGRKLNICVGSYADSALAGQLQIIQAYHQGQYAICIEVRDGAVKQAKTPYNGIPNPELAAHVEEWAKQAGLRTTDTTFDLSGDSDTPLASILREPMELRDIMHLTQLHPRPEADPFAQPEAWPVRALGADEDLPF